MEQAINFLNEAGAYFIATVDSDGKPHVRPFGSRSVIDGKFYITTNFPKAVYQQIRESGWVELAAMGKDRSWMRIAAKAVFVEDLGIRGKIAESFRGMMVRTAEDIAAFELTEATCTFYKGEETTTITW